MQKNVEIVVQEMIVHEMLHFCCYLLLIITNQQRKSNQL